MPAVTEQRAASVGVSSLLTRRSQLAACSGGRWFLKGR